MKTPQEKIEDKLFNRQLRAVRVADGIEKEAIRLIQILRDEFLVKIYEAKTLVERNKLALDFDIMAQAIAKNKTDYMDLMTGAVDEYYKAEYIATSKIINSSLGAKVIATTLAARTASTNIDKLMVEGELIGDVLDNYSARSQRLILRGIRLSVAGAETIPQAAQRIVDITDSDMRSARRDAITLVSAITNNAREDLYNEHPGLIQGRIQRSTLDKRTTTICGVRDGLGWDSKFKPVGHNQTYELPPLHPRCRSLMLPWLRAASELERKYQRKIPRGTRASMDGSVPAGRDFEQFFERKSEKFQKDWLGPKRWEIYKEKGLSFDDLLKPDGTTKTIKELISI